MTRAPGLLAALGSAAAVALAAAVLVGATAAPPNASPRLGTDEAFARGPHRRQVTSQGPLRWTGASDEIVFRNLPRGHAILDVHLGGHRGPVQVVADRAVVGVLEPGIPERSFPLGPTGRTLSVRLVTIPAPEGPPGAQVEAVRLRPDGGGATPPLLLLAFAVPALVLAGGALASGARPAAAALVAAAVSLLQAALLRPHGLARSDWPVSMAVQLAAGVIAAAVFARACERRHAGAGPLAFMALLFTVTVVLVLATAPVMVVSDVVFHANKLRQVAGGDLFPVSVTQHAVPFRFPYGVAFYALLAPLARLGLDPVRLVQYGAAASGIAASAALVWLLLPSGPRLAAGAAMILHLVPIVFDVYSYGNMSNIFGQSLTVLFFAWWAGGAPGGWAAGAALAALASLAHFSSFVVMAVLGLALLVAARRDGALDRTRWLGLLAGLFVAGAYYATFAPLVLQQLGRLREGGGSGKVERGLLREAWDEVLWIRIRWGLPALLLAIVGRPRDASPLDRALLAFWASGLVLAVLAVTTPLEVRYVYALSLPLAVAAASGAARLGARGGPARVLAIALVAGQVIVGGQAIAEAVFQRYR